MTPNVAARESRAMNGATTTTKAGGVMRNQWTGRLACAVAIVIGLLAAPAAYANTFVADPSIPDTTAASACTSPCALRQAIAAARAAEEAAGEPLANTIELPAGTYTLTQGPLRVAHPFEGSSEHATTLVGLGGYADAVVITAAGKSRVLVDGNSGGTSGLVELRRLEITGGDGEGGIPEPNPNEPEIGEGGGIAIEQNGTLKLDEVLVQGNTAGSAGGGIEDVGELTVENSTIAHNTVTGGVGLKLGIGGGISSENLNGESHESIKIVNSTLAFNSVTGGSKGEGGAIFNGTVLELTNSTLSGNSAPSSGGALAGFKNGAAPKLGVSTLANNIIAYNTGKDCAGTLPTSKGGNDFDDASCEVKAAAEANKDILKNPELELENSAPRLEENGGFTPTIAFANATSPAIGAGLEANCPAADQRGTARPAHADCSSGAYQYELGPPSSPPAGTAYAYFDAQASSEGNGTRQAPFRSVRALEPLLERRAEEISHEHGEVSPLDLFFAGGEYEGLEFSGMKEISVYGDLNPSTWKAEREPADPTRFQGTPQGLLLDGSTEMSFQQVRFQGVAGRTGSVYGVRMIHGSAATFTDIAIAAGNAAAGVKGATGATGAAGGNGEAGSPGETPGDVRGIDAELAARASFLTFEAQQFPACPGIDQHGNWAGIFAELETIYRPYSSCGSAPAPPGSQWTREPGDGGVGGWGGWLHGSGGGGRAGGEGSPAIDDNAVGAAGGTGGAAGTAEGTWCCENGKSAVSAGTAGKNGGQGSQGASQSTQPTSAADLYQQGAGARGGTGFSGGGGGGGAGGSGDFDALTNGGGDGGGAGGAGGFGGEGGAGGEEGGGSFGLYLADRSSAKVEVASELSSGRGGPGGEGGSGGGGGAGGSGGKGAAYAASTIGAGSNGGAGGGGGPGGGGGGGAGGPSYAVFGPGESVELAPGTIEHVGAPGLGGYPGGWGGEPGPSGGGGPNSPCSANCKVNPNLPVQLPPSATVSQGVVVITIGCIEACTGKLTLSGSTFVGKHHVKALALAAKHSKDRPLLGKLSFSLRAKKLTKLKIHLSKAARKQLKGLKKGFPATLTVQLKLGKAKKAARYTQAIELLPPAAGKPPKAK
jgi:hypothetical protein